MPFASQPKLRLPRWCWLQSTRSQAPSGMADIAKPAATSWGTARAVRPGKNSKSKTSTPGTRARRYRASETSPDKSESPSLAAAAPTELPSADNSDSRSGDTTIPASRATVDRFQARAAESSFQSELNLSPNGLAGRSEERRVGKESRCRIFLK